MRVILICKYDGSNYHGFQIQPNKITIQEVIEKSLRKLHNKSVRIHMSGRTDAGVHAYIQPIHFDTELILDNNSWVRAVNAYLPKDVVILGAITLNENFHVRYDSISKTYIYKLYIGKYVDPFNVRYVGHFPFKFDYERALECVPYFLGEHDFSSFCSKNNNIENKIRTITNFTINKENEYVTFEISGDGFLYNMVRIIVGTILDVASGKINKEYIETIFEKKDRKYAGKRVSPSGLYLKSVYYNNAEVNQLINNCLKL